jgi:type VI secretion system protein VasG
VRLRYDDRLIEAVAARCTEVESGARNVDNILTNTLLPELSRLLLERMAEGERLAVVAVAIGDDGAFRYDVERPSDAVPRPTAEPALAGASGAALS